MITRNILFLGFMSYLLLSQMSCFSSERRNQAESDLERICKVLPIPVDFRETSSQKTVDFMKVVLTRNYKTKADCQATGQFYRDYFLQQGWDRNRMTSRTNKGGMDTISYDFREGEYLASVECQTDAPPEDEKIVGIDCSWGLRN